MSDESDGVNEMVSGGMRIGATAALHFAEFAARVRERRAVELQARMQAATRQMTRAWIDPHLDRLVDEGTLGRDAWAELARDPATEALSRLVWTVHQDGHDPQQVLREAIARRSFDGAHSVAQVLHGRIRTEYESGRLAARERAAAAAREDVAAAAAVDVAGAAERTAEDLRAAAGGDDTQASLHTVAATQAAAEGDEPNAHREHARSDALHDTAERRRDAAADLERTADAEVAEAWAAADTHQAVPAGAATSRPERPKARRARSGSRGRGRSVER